MKTKKYLSSSDYYWHIKSDAWSGKHYKWLKQSGNRCSMLPWGKIGKYTSRKYGKYNIHHTGVGYRHWDMRNWVKMYFHFARSLTG